MLIKNSTDQYLKLESKINDLMTWPEEWDGYQMAPSHESITAAFSWIKSLYQEVSREDEKWLDPLITADSFENVVFEWWEGRKKLTVYVTPETVEYLKVWGPDIFSDMEDGLIETPKQYLILWNWLISQKED